MTNKPANGGRVAREWRIWKDFGGRCAVHGPDIGGVGGVLVREILEPSPDRMREIEAQFVRPYLEKIKDHAVSKNYLSIVGWARQALHLLDECRDANPAAPSDVNKECDHHQECTDVYKEMQRLRSLNKELEGTLMEVKTLMTGAPSISPMTDSMVLERVNVALGVIAKHKEQLKGGGA